MNQATHEGTLATDRQTARIDTPTFRAMTSTVKYWAECSCGWKGPRYESAAPTPQPQWDLNLHLAEQR